MAKVHIVSHTHWDREWYFTTADAFVLSENCFTEVLDELERNNKAKFCLDGQSSILDDYVALRPDRVELIKKLVAEKRLFIGPWYTQTDAFFVNAESIIRNLVVGIRDCQKYGEHMKVGYLPDTFGFNAQLPTIMQNCGIDNIVFWRGINFKKHVSGPYFKWKGLGDKETHTVNLVDGYGSAAHLKDTQDYIDSRLVPATEKVIGLSGTSEILLTAGGDQLDIVRDLPEKLESISKKTDHEYFVSSFDEFIGYVRQLDGLEEYEGEFREPGTSRVHKTIGSVRYDIKRTNYIIEQKLLNRVEPLIAIARANKIDISEKMLHVAWKKILEGHAHDSMGGCVSDDVAIDILHRMKEANEMADGIENVILKRLSEQIGLAENQVIIFNTLPRKFSGYKVVEFMCPTKDIRITGHDEAIILDAIYYEGKDNLLLETPEGNKYINEDPYYKLKVLIDIDLPSMGYTVVNYEKADLAIKDLSVDNSLSISNEMYTIQVNNNELKLTTSFGKSFSNFLQFEDCGNDGDTYDFSPLRGDEAKLLSLSLVEVRKSDLLEEMHLRGEFVLPLNLIDRVDGNDTGKLSIDLKLRLLRGSDRIDCTCHVENQVYSHRLRLKVNTDVFAKDTIASLPFGFIRRQVQNKEPENWQSDNVEIPIDIEPYDASVSVEGDKFNINAFGKGIKEYQFIDDSLYLTLFASTGQLGKPNLLYRPGRASGDTTKKGHIMIPTPMAELIGNLEFEFSFSILDGSFDEYRVAKIWEEYTSENICYQNQLFNKFIHRLDNKVQSREEAIKSPNEFSLLSVDDDSLYSCFHPSLYDNNAFVLRLKNPTGTVKCLDKVDFSQFSRVERINYVEEICSELNYEIPAYDSITLKLWM